MPHAKMPSAIAAFQAQAKALGIHLYSPHPELLPWIECYWYAPQNTGITSSHEFYWYPDGGTSFILQTHQQAAQKTHHQAYLKQFFHVEKLKTEFLKNQWGIRFKPGALHYFFKLSGPIKNILPIDIAECVAPQLQSLLDQNSLTPQAFEQVQKIDTWLFALLEKQQPLLKQTDWASFAQNPEQLLDLKKLQTHLRRKLERQFQHYLGTSPAHLRLLQQIKMARLAIKAAPDSSLGDIAVLAGFYDQAHFHRHFRQVTGQTPGQYRQRQMS